MSIRKQVLLSIALIFTALIVVLFVVARTILLDNLRDVEARSVRDDVNRATNMIQESVHSLEITTADWASWDDTYRFIQDGNPEYIESNLIDDTFVTLGLNIVLYIDTSGEIVFQKAFDIYRGEETDLPPVLSSLILPSGPIVNKPGSERVLSGVLDVGEASPLIMASMPVLTSDDEGPVRGTLLFGRYLDAAEVIRIGSITGLTLSVYGADGYTSDPVLSDIRRSLLEESPVQVRILDEHYVAGYSLMNGVFGDPEIVIKAQVPRDIYNQGQIGIFQIVLAIVIVGVVIGLIAMFAADKQGLGRMNEIIREVQYITETGDITERMKIGGRDELAVLARHINGMLGAFQEIENELKDSMQRYRSIFETTGAAMALSDENTILMLVNSEFVKLTGYSKEELEGKQSWFNFLGPEEQARFRQNSDRRKPEEISTSNIESRLITKDGTIKDILLNVDRIPDTGVFVASILDITEAKQSRNALADAYEKEKHLREALETEIAKRNEYTRTLVHELKTPLTPIMASSEALTLDLEDERLLRLAHNVNRGANRLNKRIDELLDLSRGELGILTIDKRPVDLDLFIKDIADEVAPEFARYGQSLILEVSPSLPVLRADRERLHQVMMNLLNNAIKYTQEGDSVTLRAGVEDGCVRIDLEDTGMGISEEELPYLFQPYFQHEADRARYSGMGLGLSLSKALVELHGGRIWVESKKGEGSIFSFTIPVSDREKAHE